MPDFLEERHELKTARRVVDVRPVSTKFAEWLTDRFNLFVICVPNLALMNMFPSIGWIFAATMLTLILVHRNTKELMPLRYPAMQSAPNPATGKPGDGILFFGNIRSSSPYEKLKEVWGSDDGARKHMLIIGSTGSGKSETLKGIFFNSLAWSSGYFVADGKADNKLPTDNHSLARSFGRDDDLLYLNFLLGGRTPEQVRRSRRRRTNKLNPFSTADADTVIQMGANMLPKVEGEGKNWQEKALNLWRALVVALCYKRDTQGIDLSVSTLIEYMALPKIEELYLEGYEEAQQRGEWSYGFVGIKSYLDTGCPAYKVDKLLAKHGYGDAAPPPGAMGGRPGAAGGKQFEQDSMAYEQHSYRTTQLMPVLNLLDKTYGFIFRDKYPEIDMVDVALNNRILCMLIPSLEKSSQEAENLGKLAIASLRVMMGRNLGSEIEGHREQLLSSKATNAPYPYTVALDELAYYFADGIAVMFAQARSLGMQMIAAAQDLEKLTEGNRASEAGAMLANQVTKIFMRIDDAKKTYEMISTILGKVTVAVRESFELGAVGWHYKGGEVSLKEVERAPLAELQGLGPGQGLINAEGKTHRIATFYVGNDLNKYRNDEFFVLRFLQVAPPQDDEVRAMTIPIDQIDDPVAKGQRMLQLLRYERSRAADAPPSDPVINAVAAAAASLGPYVPAETRAIALYMAARRAIVGDAAAAPADVPEAGSPAATTLAARPDAQDEPVRRISRYGNTGAAAPQETAPPAPAAAPAPAQAPATAPAVDAAPVDDDPLAFLDYNGSFERKPVEQLLAPASSAAAPGAAPVESAVQAVVFDRVETMMASGRFVNMPRAPSLDLPDGDSLSPAEALAAGLIGLAPENDGTATAPAVDEANAWMADAFESARGAPGAPPADNATAVGFSPPTLEKVEHLEDLLGSPDPHQAARKLETVVSAGVTPDTTPEVSVDMADIDSFFDTLKGT